MPRVPVYRLPSRLARALVPLVVSALALTLVLACGGAAPEGDGYDGGNGGTPVAQQDAAAASAVTLGRSLDDAGRVPDGEASTDFSAGETVYLSLAVGDAEPGTEVEVVWYGPEGLEAAADQGTVAAGGTALGFSADTTGWAPGTYRGEVWVGNELKEELELTVR
jgi:hypothetical protein